MLRALSERVPKEMEGEVTPSSCRYKGIDVKPDEPLFRGPGEGIPLPAVSTLTDFFAHKRAEVDLVEAIYAAAS